MDPTTSDQIESHIHSTREDLRSNLEELESRVKSAVDWREQFRRNPGLGVGLALGTGFLLALVTATPRRRAERDRGRPAAAERRGHLGLLWESVQSTMIGIAAARATDLVTALLLGRSREPVHETSSEPGDLQGEGDYRAARRYRQSAESYAHSADIERAARAAAPRDSAQAAAMEQAEAAGRSRAR